MVEIPIKVEDMQQALKNGLEVDRGKKAAGATHIIFEPDPQSDAKAEISEKDRKKMLELVENTMSLYKEPRKEKISVGTAVHDYVKSDLLLYHPLKDTLRDELMSLDLEEISFRFRSRFEEIKKEIETIAFEEFGKNQKLLARDKNCQLRSYPNMEIYKFLYGEIKKIIFKYCDEYLQEKKGGVPKPKPAADPAVHSAEGFDENAEIGFSPEQMRELDDFCNVIKEEYSERFFKRNLQERTFLWEVQVAFRIIFREDYIREGIFSEADEDAAIKFITEKVKEDIKI